jgi:hypothetical protein
MKWIVKVWKGNKETRLKKKEIISIAEKLCKECNMDDVKGIDAVLFWIEELFTELAIRTKKKQYVGFGIVEEYDWVTAVDCEDVCYSLEVYNSEGWAINPSFALHNILDYEHEWDKLEVK